MQVHINEKGEKPEGVQTQGAETEGVGTGGASPTTWSGPFAPGWSRGGPIWSLYNYLYSEDDMLVVFIFICYFILVSPVGVI